MNRLILLLALTWQSCLAAQKFEPSQQWTQWGGENRNFIVAAGSGLIKEAPKLSWEKSIGPGHSAVIVDGQFAYCQFFENEKEVIRRYELIDGESDWEFSYGVGYTGNSNYPGPHPTPLLASGKLIVASSDAQVRVIDVESGKLDWTVDLRDRFRTVLPQSGYASSPMVHNNLVIVPTLGESQNVETETFRAASDGAVPGMVALSLDTGETVWKSPSFRSSHASPTVIDISGQATVVLHGMFELVGINPEDGSIRWRQKLRNMAADNVSFPPIWDQKRSQFLLTHGYCSNGTQAVCVELVGGKWSTKIRWTNRDLRPVHTNGLQDGRLLIGTNRDPATILVGIDVESGKTVFRKRGFGKSNFVAVGDKVVVLDESGQLFCHKLDSSGFAEQWRLKVLDGRAWTVPTVAGLYVVVRDTEKIRTFVFE